MSNKGVNKDYLLRQFKNFDNNILEEKYLTKSEGGGSASSEAIAPIEESSTISHLYPVGSLLFYNNILYKTKIALTIGDTIITKGANANVEATDIDTELKNKIKVSSTVGLVKNDGTIDINLYATTTQLAGKADKVANASNGHLAGLDANGNLTDSGVLATSISGKADRTELAPLYSTADTAETTLADNDKFPFYDTSAKAKRSSTWSNIKAKLKTYFDTIYSTVKTLSALTDTTISSPANGQVLTYNSSSSKWVNRAPSGGGHTMTPTPSASLTRADLQTAVASAVTEGGINDDVVSTWAIGTWSNTMTNRVIYSGTIAVGDTGIGTWLTDAQLAALRAESDITAREALEVGTGGYGWWKDSHFIIPSGYDYDIKFKFEPHENGEVVTLGGYILDDETGCLCIKFGSPIVNAGTKIAVDITITQNNVSSSGGA